MDDRARPVKLDYRPPRADAADRHPLHPRQIIGIYMLCGSVLGVLFLCICSSQIPVNGDWSAETLAFGVAGIFLVMLAMPGMGLVFEKPEPGEIGSRRHRDKAAGKV
jgi:hypothetical protein